MKTLEVGQIVQVKKGGELAGAFGDIVAVRSDGYEVHIKTGKKLERNPVFKEYELKRGD